MTRGLVIFKKVGNVKGIYNNSDSYPEYLGKMLFDLISNNKRVLKNISLIFDRLEAVNVEDMNKRENFIDNFYELSEILEEEQDKMKEKYQYEEYFEFGIDSGYCEYGYLIDLDDKQFSVFKGVNFIPLNKEDLFFRFNTIAEKYFLEEETMSKTWKIYYPIKRIATFSFEELTDYSQEDFIKKVKNEINKFKIKNSDHVLFLKNNMKNIKNKKQKNRKLKFIELNYKNN